MAQQKAATVPKAVQKPKASHAQAAAPPSAKATMDELAVLRARLEQLEQDIRDKKQSDAAKSQAPEATETDAAKADTTMPDAAKSGDAIVDSDQVSEYSE